MYHERTQYTFDTNMPEPSLPSLLIVADSPEALTDLCGISLLERTRRIVRQLGFREATILSNSINSISEHLARQSWHGGDVSPEFRERKGSPVIVGDVQNWLSTGRILVVFADYYCDGRLLQAMAEATTNTVLMDSNPPRNCAPLWKDLERRASGWFCGMALLDQEWLSKQDPRALLIDALLLDAEAGRIASLDISRQQTYVPDLRKKLRPVCFPAPTPQRVFVRRSTEHLPIRTAGLCPGPRLRWLSPACRCPDRVTPRSGCASSGTG